MEVQNDSAIEEPSHGTGESADERSSSVEDGHKTTSRGRLRGFLHTLQRYVWDDPDKPAAEKKFLLKLDAFLLSYSCLGYFCKNLDQANISNAYVSGMKEALNMDGSQLTYMSNVFAAGYVIGQLPAVVTVTRIRPSYVIPTVETLWALCTFCSAAVTTVKQMYGLRFLLGFFEGAYFPCMMYLIGSWYTKEERAKRTVIFYCTSTLATMFDGYLQAGAYDNLNGVLGHAGWQWLFIICGIISLPSALIGYVLNPDFPENTRAFYLSKEEAKWAAERLRKYGYKPLGHTPWNRKHLLRILSSWQFWVLPIGYFFVQSSLPSQQPVFALWLESKGYSVYERNVLPTAQYGIAVAVQLIAGMLSDSPLLKGRRWQPILVMQAGTLFGTAVLAAWTVSHKLKFVAYYFSYISAGVPGIYFAWFPELMPDDHEMRGFLTAASNMMSYINSIWYADAVWRTVLGPRFHAGFIAASLFNVGMMSVAILVTVLEFRDNKCRGPSAEQVETGAETETVAAADTKLA